MTSGDGVAREPRHLGGRQRRGGDLSGGRGGRVDRDRRLRRHSGPRTVALGTREPLVYELYDVCTMWYLKTSLPHSLSTNLTVHSC